MSLTFQNEFLENFNLTYGDFEFSKQNKNNHYEKFMQDFYPKGEKKMTLPNGKTYGECEDCLRMNFLRAEDACMCGYNCTIKWICINHCITVCPQGHQTKYYNNLTGFVEKANCEVCAVQIEPHFVWWGLSPDEYRKRYNE